MKPFLQFNMITVYQSDKSNPRDSHFKGEDLHGTYQYLKRDVMNAKWWSGLLSCVLLACDWKDTVHVRKLSFITSFFFHVRLSINKQNLLHLYMSQGTQLYVVYLYERTVTLKNLIIKMLTCNIHAILLSPSLYSDLVVLSQRNTHIFSSSFIISPCASLKP